MSKVKIAKRDEVLKHIDEGEYARILEGVCEKVKGMVGMVLEGAKEELQKELHGIGVSVMEAIIEMEITGVVGAKGAHREDRTYYRGGSNPGSVNLDGEKVGIDVPRAVTRETKVSYGLKSYPLFHGAAGLVKRAYQDLIRGVSTRRFGEGVEKFLNGYGFSASTVSRHMKEATSAKLKELMERPLKDLDVLVLMIDGVRITKDVIVVVALGIDTEGVKHVLGLRQGSTENSRVVTMLLENLMERGMNVERPLLVVIDGAKALRSAVRSILGEEIPVQRCTVHKARNVEEELPKKDRPWVRQVMQRAYNADDEKTARVILKDLIEKLKTIAPEAARSLEEGLDETLTVHRLGLPPLLRKSLRSTNMLESANNGVRDRTRNLKMWRKGRHANAERWVAAGLVETAKGFRAIKGHKQLSILAGALENLRGRSQAA
jgi:transposase-like protein